MMKWLWCGSCNLMLDFYFMFFALLAWDQAPQWGKKEKRGQIGKISASEASPVVVWEGKKGPDYLSARFRLADFFFLFPPMRSMVPGYCSS